MTRRTSCLLRTLADAFDRDLPSKVIHDPYAHEDRAGPVLFEFSPTATAAARARLVAVLSEAFAA